jgi:hypothetical protein
MITQSSFFDCALTYASYGYKLLPLKGKRPTLPNWPNTASNDVADLHKWFNHANPPNIGILTGAPSGIVVFDIDTKPGKQGAEHLAFLEEKYGTLPMTYTVRSGSGGWHFYFKYPDHSIASQKPYPDVEIKSDGSQVVAPPSSCVGIEKHHTQPYTVSLNGVPAPVDLPSAWIAFLSRGPSESDPKKTAPLRSQQDPDETRSALMAIPSDLPHDDWVKVGMSLYSIDPGLESLWHEWSARSPQYKHAEASIKWKSFAQNRSITSGTLFKYATDAGWQQPKQKRLSTTVSPPPVESLEDRTPIVHTALSRTPRFLETSEGGMKPVMHNAVELFLCRPEFDGCIGFNVLASKIEWLKRPPFQRVYRKEYRDIDSSEASLWISTHYQKSFSTLTVEEALTVVAHRSPFNPIKDWLESLEWDGKGRLNFWLSDIFGTGHSPYHANVGKNWLISLVARAYAPGCQVDTMPILVGGEGLKKSKALAELGGGWDSDTPADPSGKDFYQAIQGKWIIEFAELSKLVKTDIEEIKRMITVRDDHFRKSYGRATESHKRMTVFAETTNAMECLRVDQ